MLVYDYYYFFSRGVKEKKSDWSPPSQSLPNQEEEKMGCGREKIGKSY